MKPTDPELTSRFLGTTTPTRNEILDYRGYSIEELKGILDYDGEKGTFTSKKTNKELVDRGYCHRIGDKVTKFSLARVAMMFILDDYLDDKDRVAYRDGDVYNLKADNLYLVPYSEVYKKNSLKNEYLETEHEHIYVGTANRLFVVRRGPNQAVYRTYDKDVAVAVRDRWLLSGKTLHEWDSFTPKWYRNYIESEEKEDFSTEIENYFEENVSF